MNETEVITTEHAIRMDESGHWYVVPAHECERFDKWLDLVGRFSDEVDEYEFDCYRINASPNQLRFVSWRLVD